MSSPINPTVHRTQFAQVRSSRYLAPIATVALIDRHPSRSFFGRILRMDDDDVKKIPGKQFLGFCAVCGDKANGSRYGAPACLGCIVFFRRAVCKQAEYRCPKAQKCEITFGKSLLFLLSSHFGWSFLPEILFFPSLYHLPFLLYYLPVPFPFLLKQCLSPSVSCFRTSSFASSPWSAASTRCPFRGEKRARGRRRRLDDRKMFINF